MQNISPSHLANFSFCPLKEIIFNPFSFFFWVFAFIVLRNVLYCYFFNFLILDIAWVEDKDLASLNTSSHLKHTSSPFL